MNRVNDGLKDREKGRIFWDVRCAHASKDVNFHLRLRRFAL